MKATVANHHCYKGKEEQVTDKLRHIQSESLIREEALKNEAQLLHNQLISEKKQREHYEVQANTYYRQIKLQDEQLANLMEKSLALCTVKPQSENAGNNIITPNCLSVNDQTHQSRPTLSTPHCSNSADLPSSKYYLSQGNMDPLSNFFPSKLECKVDGKQFLYIARLNKHSNIGRQNY